MCFNQRLVASIMAIKAQRGRRLREMKGKLWARTIAAPVSRMASVATEIERLMPATTLYNIHSRTVASQAEILAFVGT